LTDSIDLHFDSKNDNESTPLWLGEKEDGTVGLFNGDLALPVADNSGQFNIDLTFPLKSVAFCILSFLQGSTLFWFWWP